MTRDHSVIEELMAIDALGGLDDDDRATLERERASHGPDCAECAAFDRGFAETAGRLAFALEPEPVDDDMLERILATPRQNPAVTPAVVAPLGDEVVLDEVADRRARLRPWQALVAAAAVVAVLAVALTTLLPPTTEVNEALPAHRIVTFSGDSDGTLAMAYTPGEPGAVLWGSGLPDPGPGMVYEIWMIEGDRPVSGGCVAPTDGVVAVRVDADIGTTDTMAVTRESSTCPAAPTSPPVLLADLTTVV
jgi:Anti-sigma-K factor rskA